MTDETTTEPHDLILDHLRHIRSKIHANGAALRDMKEQITSLRAEVNGLRSEFFVRKGLAAVELDIDRIKSRLDLTDPR